MALWSYLNSLKASDHRWSFAPTGGVSVSWSFEEGEMENDLESLRCPLGSQPPGLPARNETLNQLSTDLTDYRLAPRKLEGLESAGVMTGDSAKREGMQLEVASNNLEEGSCFSPTLSLPGGGQESLPEEALAPNNSPQWIITAPAIENAIRNLCERYGRSPTDLEIAEELQIDQALYWETLSHLKDLEIGVLYAAHDPHIGAEWRAYGADRAQGDVRFRCLRSEMQALFRSAIRNLPTMERLVITLSYEEDLYDKSISVILVVPESTVSGLRKSAFLHLRAALPNPSLQGYVRSRSFPPPPAGGEASEHAQASTVRMRDERDADVTVHGSQNGSLANGQPWDYVGDRAVWYRNFRSWYLLDDEEKLTQIKRVERYHLDFEL
jgi:DNA-directed RNA polymerase specialized sigma24 family protein